MPENFVENHLRRLTIRWIVIFLAGIFLVVLCLVLSAGYFYNMALGPFPVESAALIAITPDTIPSQYYVTVQGDDNGDTGITRVDGDNGTVEAYFHALYLGDRLLLVETSTESITNTVTGAIVRIANETQTNVVDRLEADYPELKGVFLPVMIDAGNFYENGFIGLGLAAAAALFCLLGFGINLFHLFSPASQPALKALERFGDPEQAAAEIDREIARPHMQVGKGIHFTENWLVNTSRPLGAFEAARCADIVWAYKHVQKTSYMFIPVSRTFAAVVWDRYGKQSFLQGKETEVQQVLQEIQRRVPGVMLGYSAQLLKLWRGDRDQFLATVQSRRASGGAGGQTASLT